MTDLEVQALIVILGPLIVLLGLFLLLVKRYKKVGVNEALVISGGKHMLVEPGTGERKVIGTRIVTGRGAFVMPLIERAERISLEVLRVPLDARKVLTGQREALAVEGIAQVKIRSGEASIRTAAEHFLSKSSAEIAEIVAEVLESRLRSVVGAITAEAIHHSLDGFSRQMAEAAAADLAGMGMELISLSIKDVSAPGRGQNL